MCFILNDYIQYKYRIGKYDISKDKIMMWGHEERIPQIVINEMRAGDLIFLFSYNSVLSWLIMYFTNARVSHVATFIGRNKVIHATLGGVIKEEINTLFGKDNILVVCSPRHITTVDRKNLVKAAENILGWSYSMKLVINKLIRIIIARDVRYFRWQFMLDSIFVFSISDLILYFIFRVTVFTYIAIPYLALVFINYFFIGRYFPLKKEKATPISFLKGMLTLGAEILTLKNYDK